MCLDSAQGTEGDALRQGAPPQRLKPPWKVMLLSDGSVTRHLQLLTGLKVQVVRGQPLLVLAPQASP